MNLSIYRRSRPFLILLVILVAEISVFSQCQVPETWYEEGYSAEDLLQLQLFDIEHLTYFDNSVASALALQKCGSGDHFMTLYINQKAYHFEIPQDDLSHYWNWANDPHPMTFYWQNMKDENKHTKPEFQIDEYYPTWRCENYRMNGDRCARFTRNDNRFCWQHQD